MKRLASLGICLVLSLMLVFGSVFSNPLTYTYASTEGDENGGGDNNDDNEGEDQDEGDALGQGETEGELFSPFGNGEGIAGGETSYPQSENEQPLDEDQQEFETVSGEICHDGFDNDGDSMIDLADDECSGSQTQGSVTPTPLSPTGSQQQQQQQPPQTLSATPGTGGDGDGDIRVGPKTLFGIPIGGSSIDQTPTDQTPTDQTPTDQTPTDQTPTDQTPTDQTPTDQRQPPAQGSQLPPLIVPINPVEPLTSFPPSSDSLTAVTPPDTDTDRQVNTQPPPVGGEEPSRFRKGAMAAAGFGAGFGLSFLPFDDYFVDQYGKKLVMPHLATKSTYDSGADAGKTAGNAMQLALLIGIGKLLGKEGIKAAWNKFVKTAQEKYSQKAIKAAGEVGKKTIKQGPGTGAGESISNIFD
jgi:hypothetical protein